MEDSLIMNITKDDQDKQITKEQLFILSIISFSILILMLYF